MLLDRAEGHEGGAAAGGERSLDLGPDGRFEDEGLRLGPWHTSPMGRDARARLARRRLERRARGVERALPVGAGPRDEIESRLVLMAQDPGVEDRLELEDREGQRERRCRTTRRSWSAGSRVCRRRASQSDSGAERRSRSEVEDRERPRREALERAVCELQDVDGAGLGPEHALGELERQVIAELEAPALAHQEQRPLGREERRHPLAARDDPQRHRRGRALRPLEHVLRDREPRRRLEPPPRQRAQETPRHRITHPRADHAQENPVLGATAELDPHDAAALEVDEPFALLVARLLRLRTRERRDPSRARPRPRLPRVAAHGARSHSIPGRRRRANRARRPAAARRRASPSSRSGRADRTGGRRARPDGARGPPRCRFPS